jgi:S-adenosylmethionine:tRNA ribosyltransferase-isomerase
VHPRDLSITDHTYTLPPDRIAAHPLADRDASRLLQYRQGAITDHTFRDLPGLLTPGSLLLMNDTRVVNARLLFRRETGAVIEVFCLEPDGDMPVEQAFLQRGEVVWRCALGNARRWKDDVLRQLYRAPRGAVQLFAQRAGFAPQGQRVRLSWLPAELTFAEVLDLAGDVPLPPYLQREAEAEDAERYQTVYAQHAGSVAAPTAGLHFTPALLDRLDARGVVRQRVTLHVGAGTFAPVKAGTMAGHAMHQERVQVSRATVQALLGAIGQRPVVVVGTTTLRTVESLYWHGAAILRGGGADGLRVEQWEPYGTEVRDQPAPEAALEAVLAWMDLHGFEQVSGETRLLIAPGYRVRMADALITNFHQPNSTLLLLVAACVGDDWRRIYHHALDHGYRFLSYGDGSLLWCREHPGQ